MSHSREGEGKKESRSDPLPYRLHSTVLPGVYVGVSCKHALCWKEPTAATAEPSMMRVWDLGQPSPQLCSGSTVLGEQAWREVGEKRPRPLPCPAALLPTPTNAGFSGLLSGNTASLLQSSLQVPPPQLPQPLAQSEREHSNSSYF